MSIIVVAKNNTASEYFIEDLGIGISGTGQVNLTDLFDFFEIIDSIDLKTGVSSGDIIINDGTNDLNIVDGLAHINVQSTTFGNVDGSNVVVDPSQFNDVLSVLDNNVQNALLTINSHSHTSQSLNLDSTAFNDVLSIADTNLQLAMETLDQHSHPSNNTDGGMGISFFRHSEVSNKWLKISDNINSDEVPFIIPYNMRIVAITFNNEENDNSTNCDIKIYKNGKNSVNVIYTFLISNTKSDIIDNLSIPLVKNDKLSVKITNGDNCKDPVVYLFFKE